ncbi:MAG: hypothetical protein FJW35_03385 [Acidobacteria bacterium]|nr:hypothetical protein [Acidobacteriota bacterium]
MKDVQVMTIGGNTRSVNGGEIETLRTQLNGGLLLEGDPGYDPVRREGIASRLPLPAPCPPGGRNRRREAQEQAGGPNPVCMKHVDLLAKNRGMPGAVGEKSESPCHPVEDVPQDLNETCY